MRKRFVTTQASGVRHPFGFGYVVIPKDADRNVYIESCLRTFTVTMLLENGGWIDNVPVFKSAFNEIEFPETSNELGSQVFWGNIGMLGFPAIVSVGLKTNEFFVVKENQFVNQKNTKDGTVEVRGDAKQVTYNIIVNSTVSKKGVFNVLVSNSDKTAQFNTTVKGTKKTDIEGSETINVTDTINFNIGSGENITKISIVDGKGISIEDNFGNKITTEKDLIKLNEGDNNGLAIVKELTTKYNNLENKYNSLLQILQTVIIPLAPSGTYPFAQLFASQQPLTPTQQSEIENKKVTH